MTHHTTYCIEQTISIIVIYKKPVNITDKGIDEIDCRALSNNTDINQFFNAFNENNTKNETVGCLSTDGNQSFHLGFYNSTILANRNFIIFDLKTGSYLPKTVTPTPTMKESHIPTKEIIITGLGIFVTGFIFFVGRMLFKKIP